MGDEMTDAKRRISRMQAVELNILKEIDRICEEHGVTYFLIGGSMLGAVRHKGFIPWDDDIDIAMIRDDYDKFIKLAEDELTSPFAIHTYRNTPSHHYYFAHAVDTRYQVRRTGSQDQRIEDVWVDIYPIDGLPDNRMARAIHVFSCLFYRFMYHLAFFEKISINRSDRPLGQKIILRIIAPFQSAIKPDKNKWRDRMDRALRKYRPQDSELSINFISVYLMRELFPTRIFTELAEYPFEDMIVKGPKDFDTYLTGMYGDYMTPVSPDQAHPIEMLFEDDYVAEDQTGFARNDWGTAQASSEIALIPQEGC